MRPLMILVFWGLLAAIAASAQADEPDPIRAKLDAAVKNFGVEQTKFKEGSSATSTLARKPPSRPATKNCSMN